jgi:hypothetical protein
MRTSFDNSVPSFFSQKNLMCASTENTTKEQAIYVETNKDSHFQTKASLLNSFNLCGFSNSQEIPQGPGLYAIFCTKKNKIYFGESSNVTSRLGRHWYALINKTHDCKVLQNDFDLYGSNFFEFYILSIGSNWISKFKRKKKEEELIKANKRKVYNMEIYDPKSAYRKIVKYKNQSFPTIAEASRQTGVAKTTIRRNCLNKENQDWSFIETPFTDQYVINQNSSNLVCVEGAIYRSERKAASETGISRKILRRQLDSPNYPNTYRISKEAYEKLTFQLKTSD